MKKSLWKNNFKEILKTRRRFVSILIMAFLGVGFFSGLVATSPDMQDSLDEYADSTNLFDIDIVSTLGITEDDVNQIRNIDGIADAYGIQTKDSMVRFCEKESICKVIEYNESSNLPVLVYGRLPENSSECLLDYKYSIIGDVQNYIGKNIVLENDDLDSDDNPIFTQKEFKVVGIVESPLYISNERGNTSIGKGSIDFYIYVRDDVINMDYYTNLYATICDAKDTVVNSDKYWNLVNPVVQNIEEIKQEREDARYNQLINEATTKLDKAQNEFNDKNAEVDAELLEAESKINDAKIQIEDSEKKLSDSEKELNVQEANAKKQFESAEKQIVDAENQIASKKQELENGKYELESKKNELSGTLQQLNSGIMEANNKLTLLQTQKDELENNGVDTVSVDVLITQVKATLEELNGQKTQIEQGLVDIKNQVTYAENEISKAEKELQTQRANLNSTRKLTNTKIANGRNAISDGRKELEKAKQELIEKEKEFINGKEESATKLNNAQKELDDAREEINKIEKAKWYVRTRKDNNGYTNMIDAIKTLTNISKIFPVIFYLIAILISLTSMTRMIEEERIEIGTLKALGYTNMQIISKYVLYALLACIIGGFLGMTVGFYLIPNIVWSIYSSIYTIPKFYATYRLGIGLKGLIIAFICIGGATILVAIKELKNMPSVLMRPKAPKNGKKILLEKITFVWRRLNFSKKVTARNIFRYKKRAIMTIVRNCWLYRSYGYRIWNQRFCYGYSRITIY